MKPWLKRFDDFETYNQKQCVRMTHDQLRKALGELNGERNIRFMFVDCVEALHVSNALLVPKEVDRIVKLTDGRKEYLIDADRVLWVEIG